MAAQAPGLRFDLECVQASHGYCGLFPNSREESHHVIAGGSVFQIKVRFLNEFDQRDQREMIQLLGNKCGLLSLIAVSRKIHSTVCEGKSGPDCAKHHLGEKELAECAGLYAAFPATIWGWSNEDGYAFTLIPADKFNDGVHEMQKILAAFKNTYPDKAKKVQDEEPNKKYHGLLTCDHLAAYGTSITKMSKEPSADGSSRYSGSPNRIIKISI